MTPPANANGRDSQIEVLRVASCLVSDDIGLASTSRSGATREQRGQREAQISSPRTAARAGRPCTCKIESSIRGAQCVVGLDLTAQLLSAWRNVTATSARLVA